MSLGFSHGDAHWSYSGFHRARVRLAATIGVELKEMEGFGGRKPWHAVPAHPLVALLNHSDCDGTLSPEQCATIAPVLRRAVVPWGEDDYDKRQFMRLAEGMEEAARANEELQFI